VAFIGLEVVFPAVFAVFGMGEDFQDEDAAGVVMDGCDQAVVIAGDVENGDGLGTADGGEVGMRENLAHFGDGSPLRSGGHGNPRGEIGCDVRVLLGIGEEAALGDDSDSENLLSN
jgi:hypothetical protein